MTPKKINVTLFFMFLILLNIVSGSVIIQISEDNSTWKNINSSFFDGNIDEVEMVATAKFLELETNYFFRGKDSETQFTYGQFKTEGSLKMLAVIIGLGLVALWFWFMGFRAFGYATKVLFYGVSFVQIITISFIIYLNEIGEPFSNILKTNFQVLFLISFVVSFLALLSLAIKLMTPEQEDANEDDLEGEHKWLGHGKWDK